MKKTIHIVYIGVGSNVGDRAYMIQSARTALNETKGTRVLRSSKVYETLPYGYRNQERFLNCVFEAETERNPEELLKMLLAIEKLLKRTRVIHWGPRTIDLDILLYDDWIVNSNSLTIPHKELHKRLFVLTPLADLVPDLVHPIRKISIRAMEQQVKENTSQAGEVAPLGIHTHQ